jgi:ADP-ribose pyrophosphatase
MTFTVLNRKNVYHGRAFDVELVRFTLPNGKEQDYDLVSHLPAVTLVPLDGEGRLWFVSQFRLGSMADMLELPAGVLEAGEPPEAGAARELREETGKAAGALRLLGGFHMAPGYSSEYMYVFLATGLYDAPLEADADEFLQVRRLPLEEVYAMARRGEISDGKTLAALLLAEGALRE